MRLRAKYPGLKPRILIVDLSPFFGGGEAYVSQLVSLIFEDYCPTVLCLNRQLVHNLKRKGISVISLEPLAKLGKVVYVATAMALLPVLISLLRVDIVWIQRTSEVWALPIARLFGRKAVATWHCMSITAVTTASTPAYRLRKMIYRAATRFADIVFAVSYAVAEDLKTVLPRKSVVVIPNWIAPCPSDLNEGERLPERFRILFVGRLEPAKGAETLIDAVKKIDRKDVSVVFVGDGSERRALHTRAQGINAEFVGFCKDPRPYYIGSDLFVNPSLGPEGMPLVSLEALAHGIPCLLSDIAVHREITDNGSCARLFETGNVADLSSAIEVLMDDPALMKVLSIRGRSVIQERHIEHVAQVSYLRELHSLCREQRSGSLMFTSSH